MKNGDFFLTVLGWKSNASGGRGAPEAYKKYLYGNKLPDKSNASGGPGARGGL